MYSQFDALHLALLSIRLADGADLLLTFSLEQDIVSRVSPRFNHHLNSPVHSSRPLSRMRNIRAARQCHHVSLASVSSLRHLKGTQLTKQHPLQAARRGANVLRHSALEAAAEDTVDPKPAQNAQNRDQQWSASSSNSSSNQAAFAAVQARLLPHKSGLVATFVGNVCPALLCCGALGAASYSGWQKVRSLQADEAAEADHGCCSRLASEQCEQGCLTAAVTLTLTTEQSWHCLEMLVYTAQHHQVSHDLASQPVLNVTGNPVSSYRLEYCLSRHRLSLSQLLLKWPLQLLALALAHSSFLSGPCAS